VFGLQGLATVPKRSTWQVTPVLAARIIGILFSAQRETPRGQGAGVAPRF